MSFSYPLFMHNNPLLHLKYFFDVGSGVCLWAGDSKTEEILGYAIELEKIEISENTRKWLTYLIHWFDTSIDWEEPTKPNGNWTNLEQLNFQEAYKKGLDLLIGDLSRKSYKITVDENMAINQLPEGSNFFATIFTEKSKEEISQIYESAGWKVRKSSFTDFEISQDWASIAIAGNQEILMHGTVAEVENKAFKITAPLIHHKISYKVEFYDADDNLELTQETIYGK